MSAWRRRKIARGLVVGVAAFGLSACSEKKHVDLDTDAAPSISDDGGRRWDSEAPFDDDMDGGGYLGMREDASESDLDADLGDAGQGADDDACIPGEGDASCFGSSNPHPLAGRYAVRTQLYARQLADLSGQLLDVVSKGALVSIAEINALGVVHEEYCFLQINNDEPGIASWLAPNALNKLPPTDIALVERAGRYVRPLAAHAVNLGWSESAKPADCQPGQVHASGCQCPNGTELPTEPDDCRVIDLDGDGKPGVAMSVSIGATPADANELSEILSLGIVAQIALEWRLPSVAADTMVGEFAGGLSQAELDPADRSGDLATAFSSILNSICPSNLGHIELIRGDASCASLLAERASLIAAGEGEVGVGEDFGVFDLSLDPAAPAPEVCPDPDPACTTDADGDTTPDCRDACPNNAGKTTAGRCGCAAADTDGDADGTPDCIDGCPIDGAKILPGACGCGAPETNTDGDAQPDCAEACDLDGSKLVPGACGCGVPDTNSDGDSQSDCQDGCDNNPLKLVPGICGCNLADTDSDGDGVANCNDACPDDNKKTTLGLCGCGVSDADTDGDGFPACTDQCPNNAGKTAPGVCGCATADTDQDGDGTPICNDACPTDAAKISVGACGCGVAETNTDGDSAPNCIDGCVTDPLKIAVGACGCGISDINSDSDNQPDCIDGCDADGSKTAPGQCGCGVPDVDLNGDGLVDCADQCPNDPAKVAPGLCGCGTADTNSDSDSLVDCLETCDNDPAKLVPGQCGCGVADVDGDGDGVANCNDACPNDPTKAVLGLCGCGVADVDSDSDGTVNCLDACPADGGKIAVGACGCGVADTNSDGDSLANCLETCDNDPAKLAPGQCGCGVADTDGDGDGTANCIDGCPSDAGKIAAGVCGCGAADADSDGDGALNCQDQCPNNGALTTQSACGCTVCTMPGSYAVRSSVYSKQINDGAITTSKSLSYSLVTISQNANGSLTFSERSCWNQSLPNPADSGIKAYSWSRPAASQALTPSVQTLTASLNGSFVRNIPLTRLGWDPARQPASCSATSMPVAPWGSSWGSTCRCNTPASTMPPYDTNDAGFDCRVTDADGDGAPGVSAIASTNPPSSPDAAAPFLGGTVWGVANATGRWSITPGQNGRHSATISDTGTAQVIGCTGVACTGLGDAPVTSRSCPEALNKAQLVRTAAAYDTCSEIIALRNDASLFAQDQDGPWPTTAACPAQ